MCIAIYRTLTKMVLRATAAMLLAMMFFSTSSAADKPVSNGEKAIQEFWAPVIYQAAASDADYITLMDYDGDWIGANNWNNFPDHPKPAYVYYDTQETATHWFIFYGLFHPRDYTIDPECPGGCHENDMESILLVIRKDGTPAGELEAMETIHHSDMTLYTSKDYIKGGHLKVSGPITLKKGLPVIYVERYGHGIYGTEKESIEANPLVTDTVRYVYLGEAEVPDGIPDSKVSYDLVSVYDTYWQHRHCSGQGECFDSPFDYMGVTLPASMDGDDFGIDSANTPWGYNQGNGDKLVRGDWFFDPARAFLFHAGEMDNFSTEYINNRYLDDINEEKKTGE